VETVYSMMWLIKPKNITTMSTMQIAIWVRIPKDNIAGQETILTYTFQGPQVMGWAACECPLHFPGPSLFRAPSRLNLQ
jgi:hypothetical protein